MILSDNLAIIINATDATNATSYIDRDIVRLLSHNITVYKCNRCDSFTVTIIIITQYIDHDIVKTTYL